jgi:hypothetical protein
VGKAAAVDASPEEEVLKPDVRKKSVNALVLASFIED